MLDVSRRVRQIAPMATPKASLAKSGKNGHLTLWIVGAIVLAVILAIFWPSGAIKMKLGGDLFLRLLKMLIVPLVVTSVMSGVIGLGDIRKLGKPGGAAIVYYLATTLLAVVIGIVLVNLIQPGMGLSDDQRAGIEANVASNKGSIHGKMESATNAGAKASTGGILTNLFLSLAPSNLVEHAAKMDLLPLIVFSIFFAGVLTTMGSKGAPLSLLIVAANDAFLKIVLLLMKAAPLGIFCLVAARFGQAQLDGGLAREFSLIGKYSLTVLIGLAFHALLTLPLIYWIVLRKNPFLFVGKMSQALLTAFSTASSSATLPVTMECATDRAGISRKSVDFVIPIGATVNMDGTALYEAVAAIFIAQLVGMELSLPQQIIVAVTATLAAIGAAGIPEAGLFTMVIVLGAVGLPLDYVAAILSVDWLLDRFRTTVNVFGDAIGAAVVAPLFPEENKMAGTGS